MKIEEKKTNTQPNTIPTLIPQKVEDIKWGNIKFSPEGRKRTALIFIAENKIELSYFLGNNAIYIHLNDYKFPLIRYSNTTAIRLLRDYYRYINEI